MYSRKVSNPKTRNTIVVYMLYFAREMGRQPTVREIGEAAGLHSTSTTAGYLERMVRDGLLCKSEQRYRNYFVNPDLRILPAFRKAG